MNAKKFEKLVLSFVQDFEFEYKGVHGGILPFSQNEIIVFWGNEEDPPEEVCNTKNFMDCKIVDGVPLREVCKDFIPLNY